MPQLLSSPVLSATTLIVLFSITLSAKVPTVRIAISGGALSAPIETTDPAALASIWAGSFIGALSEEPDRELPRYRARFTCAGGLRRQRRSSRSTWSHTHAIPETGADSCTCPDAARRATR